MRLSLAILVLAPSLAVAECIDDAMLVFDASSSMSDMVPNPERVSRIVEARAALRQTLPLVAPVRRVGLVIFGPGEATGCSFVDVRFAPVENAAERIIAEIGALRPDGNTALTEAVRTAAEVLDYRRRAGTIVLVTDGEETCGGQTCDLAAEFAAEAPDLVVHVVGFRLRVTRSPYEADRTAVGPRQEHTEARCLAEATGGRYVRTDTIDELAVALLLTLGCPLSS